jgi:hypothetical protein
MIRCGRLAAEDVPMLVEREIAGDWTRSNAHGCDLRRCLVWPELRDFEDFGGGRPPRDPPSMIPLWLVLEESPEDRGGYKIVFDEAANKFGLAIPGSPRDVFIGHYGSFLGAYRSM